VCYHQLKENDLKKNLLPYQNKPNKNKNMSKVKQLTS